MTEHNSIPVDGPSDPGVLEFDAARYETALGPLDITDAQRAELLATLWSIMQNMVELGYSVADSKICESIFGPFIEATNSPASTVESSRDQNSVMPADDEVKNDQD